MSKLLSKLYRVNIISPKGIVRFLAAIAKNGTNLLALTKFSAKNNPNRKAISNGKKTLSYLELYNETLKLCKYLFDNYNLTKGKKVGIMCRNNIPAIELMSAVSSLGADIFLLNVEISNQQLIDLSSKYKFDFIISDDEFSEKLGFLPENKFFLSSRTENIIKNNEVQRIKTRKAGNIIVLTGGTSGKFTVTKRKPSIFNFLNPFFALLINLDLDKYKSIYVAVPIYHGFGFSALIIAMILGAEIFIQDKFETENACDFIEKNKIEVITLVPLMLRRMLNYNPQKLNSLQKILSGGASLNPQLVKQTQQTVGDKLYNLYGTTEAGFTIMAKPKDLAYNTRTIGKKINGVNLKITDKTGKQLGFDEIGIINLSTKWSMNNKDGKWLSTGDLAYIDKTGCVFLCGRADDMIVSGGENVYPISLENSLAKHQDIENVAVIGVENQEFGQRLKAFVVKKKNSNIDEQNLLNWLKGKIARYEMPVKIEFIDNLPYTPVGKVDKKQLK